jgi:hypothetical protein
VFERGSARRLLVTRTLFAVLIGLRIALGPYRTLAGQPPALFRPPSFLRLLGLDAMPSAWVIGLVQVVGVAAAVLAARGRSPRAAFVAAWLSLLFLAGLRTSLGKVLHNDTALLLATFPLLFADAGEDSSEEGRRSGWPLSLGLAVLCLIYFFAGVAKLRHSGLAWVTGDNMRYVMLSAWRGGKPEFPQIARLIGGSGFLARDIAGFILLLELLFPLAFLVPRARPLFAGAAVLLHVGTWFTLGIDYWLWAATAVLLLLDVSALPPWWAARRAGPATARRGAAGLPTARPSLR